MQVEVSVRQPRGSKKPSLDVAPLPSPSLTLRQLRTRFSSLMCIVLLGRGGMRQTVGSTHSGALRAAREHAYRIPLKDFHPGAPSLFATDTHWPYFERLRHEEPVHWCSTSPVGNYWSVTKYKDIMHVETNPKVFSSDIRPGGIMLGDVDPRYEWPSFIAMDEPLHADQRKSVQPLFSAPELAKMAVLIRARSASVLDNLPRNETFNWVERVSIELTTQMLATLFDFPWEDRYKLTRWSDVATALPESGVYASEEERWPNYTNVARLRTTVAERVKQPPRSDLISMMAHSEATRAMDRENLLGNLVLLIVGGNDTTRNSITGGCARAERKPRTVSKTTRDLALITRSCRK